MRDKKITKYRIEKIEEGCKENTEIIGEMAKTMAILQTRVYFIGIGIATFVSFVVPLARDLIKG